MFRRDLCGSDTWCGLHNIVLLVMAGVMLMATEVPAAKVSNSFVTIEGDGVISDGSGGVIRSEHASGPVTVTARPGWLVNGRESISYPSAKAFSAGLQITSKLGEDHSCCPPPPTSNDVHCTDFVIGAMANPSNVVAMYALPTTSAVVTASASSTVVKEGSHHVTMIWKEWECEICHKRQEGRTNEWDYAVSPDRYAWTATAAGLTFGTSTWTGQMSKGLDQGISFDVVGMRMACGRCRSSAHTEATADVHELSVERPDYLGLDLTDAMKGKDVTRTATAKIDPEPASATYKWTGCGRCKFIGRKDAADVTYGGNDKTGGSESYLAEKLSVTATAKNAAGQSASATCTTNFTVVAVDVGLKNWGEMMDEKNDTIIGSYVKRDGTGLFDGYPDLAKKAMLQCPMEIELFPKNLPTDEIVRLAFEDKNLIVNNDPEVAEETYTVSEIKAKQFYLFDEGGRVGKKNVEATHDASSAKDIVVYDVCCCTVTIYADVSDLFIEGAWYEKTIYFLESVFDDVGHSFCKIDIDAEHLHLVPEHLTKYIGKPYGLYPNSDSPNGNSDSYYDVASEFMAEKIHFDNVNEQKPGTVAHVWHISFDDCMRGLERMYEIATTKPKYDLMCFNCTDAAISIGRACSAPVPDAGIPDLSVLESLRGTAKGDDDWAQKFWNLWKDSDGSYSCPLGLLVNLNYTNMKYGEKE